MTYIVKHRVDATPREALREMRDGLERLSSAFIEDGGASVDETIGYLEEAITGLEWNREEYINAQPEA